MKAILRLLASTAAVLLCGCLGLGNKHEQPIVYAPTLAPIAHQSGAPVAWQLLVDVPSAVDPLDGVRIVVLPQPGIVQFYKGARWRERMPVLLQSLLLQGFADSGRLLGVSSFGSGLRGDYALHLSLTDFEADYRGAATPTIVIRLDAQLTRSSNNRVIAAHRFRIEQASDASAIGSVVSAFEQGLNTLLPQLVDWTLQSGEADWQAAKTESR